MSTIYGEGFVADRMDAEELPELPTAEESINYGSGDVPVWDADQMREYARAAVLAERERAEHDAKRYRWLKEHSPQTLAGIAYGYSPESCVYLSTDPDGAIDAAIRGNG
jgi:hypothetical protein